MSRRVVYWPFLDEKANVAPLTNQCSAEDPKQEQHSFVSLFPSIESVFMDPRRDGAILPGERLEAIIDSQNQWMKMIDVWRVNGNYIDEYWNEYWMFESIIFS